MKLRIRRKAGVALMCVGGCGQEAARRAEIRGDGEGLRQGPGSRRGCPVSTDGARPVGAPAGEPGRNAVALGNGAEAAAFPVVVARQRLLSVQRAPMLQQSHGCSAPWDSRSPRSLQRGRGEGPRVWGCVAHKPLLILLLDVTLCVTRGRFLPFLMETTTRDGHQHFSRQ